MAGTHTGLQRLAPMIALLALSLLCSLPVASGAEKLSKEERRALLGVAKYPDASDWTIFHVAGPATWSMRGTAAHPPWPEAFTAHTRRWCALLDYAEVAAILQPGNSQITAQEIELVTELAEFLRDFVSAAEVGGVTSWACHGKAKLVLLRLLRLWLIGWIREEQHLDENGVSLVLAGPNPAGDAGPSHTQAVVNDPQHDPLLPDPLQALLDHADHATQHMDEKAQAQHRYAAQQQVGLHDPVVGDDNNDNDAGGAGPSNTQNAAGGVQDGGTGGGEAGPSHGHAQEKKTSKAKAAAAKLKVAQKRCQQALEQARAARKKAREAAEAAAKAAKTAANAAQGVGTSSGPNAETAAQLATAANAAAAAALAAVDAAEAAADTAESEVAYAMQLAMVAGGHAHGHLADTEAEQSDAASEADTEPEEHDPAADPVTHEEPAVDTQATEAAMVEAAVHNSLQDQATTKGNHAPPAEPKADASKPPLGTITRARKKAQATAAAPQPAAEPPAAAAAAAAAEPAASAQPQQPQQRSGVMTRGRANAAKQAGAAATLPAPANPPAGAPSQPAAAAAAKQPDQPGQPGKAAPKADPKASLRAEVRRRAKRMPETISSDEQSETGSDSGTPSPRPSPRPRMKIPPRVQERAGPVPRKQPAYWVPRVPTPEPPSPLANPRANPRSDTSTGSPTGTATNSTTDTAPDTPSPAESPHASAAAEAGAGAASQPAAAAASQLSAGSGSAVAGAAGPQGSVNVSLGAQPVMGAAPGMAAADPFADLPPLNSTDGSHLTAQGGHVPLHGGFGDNNAPLDNLMDELFEIDAQPAVNGTAGDDEPGGLEPLNSDPLGQPACRR